MSYWKCEKAIGFPSQLTAIKYQELLLVISFSLFSAFQPHRLSKYLPNKLDVNQLGREIEINMITLIPCFVLEDQRPTGEQQAQDL